MEETRTVVSGGASQTTTERNEVNEVTRFVQEVGEFLREAFWSSNSNL
jgi:hypothetical protein